MAAPEVSTDGLALPLGDGELVGEALVLAFGARYAYSPTGGRIGRSIVVPPPSAVRANSCRIAPAGCGTEVCRALRGRGNVPIIMLTAKDSEVDKVVGLELGADDYVTKPYSARELVARIRAVLRRQGEPEPAHDGVLTAGPVRMDVERHVVTVNNQTVAMPLKEFELLEILLRNAGRVLTRMQLIDRVWGSDYVGDTKTLDVHVKRLRSKVENDPSMPRHLVTVRGLGYKFEA
ncbi:MAG TPA: response regulator transcription factor [Kineosporiaceae bacterium]|nr:response regulator transcription factor [Kineosporiaceae bacterium]